MSPTALVTGVTGQDGVLLARHLMAQGYRVIGTARSVSGSPSLPYLDGVRLVEHDLRDTEGFAGLLGTYRPDEIYNLAGFTSVGASWDMPDLVMELNAHVVERMCDAVLAYRDDTGAACRLFQASSSEVYGTDVANPQDETTPHAPCSPYGVSKSRAQQATARLRDERGLFACSGILYNHESPLRSTRFVTRKITRAAAEIALGVRESLSLGNTDVSRDWGSAHDYVVAMCRMLAQDEPADYVIATGRLHSLAQFLEAAFAAAGVSDPWSYVVRDPALVRSSDPRGLAGDASKARDELGWSPSDGFGTLVERMVAVDLRRVRSGIEEDPAYVRGLTSTRSINGGTSPRSSG